MKRQSFREVRRLLGMSQREFAAILAVSPKAVQSYEQGWRGIPDRIEKQIFFYLSRLNRKGNRTAQACWKIHRCDPAVRKECPAAKFGAGEECWFVSGNRCNGATLGSWREKREACFRCDVFLRQLKFIEKTPLHRMLLAAR